MAMPALYDALRSAGAGETLARSAAAEVAGIGHDLAAVERDLRHTKWMVIATLAMTGALVVEMLV